MSCLKKKSMKYRVFSSVAVQGSICLVLARSLQVRILFCSVLLLLEKPLILPLDLTHVHYFDITTGYEAGPRTMTLYRTLVIIITISAVYVHIYRM